MNTTSTKPLSPNDKVIHYLNSSMSILDQSSSTKFYPSRSSSSLDGDSSSSSSDTSLSDPIAYSSSNQSFDEDLDFNIGFDQIEEKRPCFHRLHTSKLSHNYIFLYCLLQSLGRSLINPLSMNIFVNYPMLQYLTRISKPIIIQNKLRLNFHMLLLTHSVQKHLCPIIWKMNHRPLVFPYVPIRLVPFQMMIIQPSSTSKLRKKSSISPTCS